jgi:hypothetical protein
MEKSLKRLFVVWSVSVTSGELICAGYVAPESARLASRHCREESEAFIGFSVLEAPEGELAKRWHEMASSPVARARELAKGTRKSLRGLKSHIGG